MARRFGKVQQLPSGNYRASFVGPDGRRVFAPVTFPDSEAADTWLTTQRADIVRGTWKAAQDTGTVTLRAYALGWLRARHDLKPRTAALYAGLLDRHILPTLGDSQLRTITPADVRVWHAELGDATGPTARAQAYRLLRTVLGQAVRDGELTANPCQIRGGGTVQHAERPAPTLPQIHAAADALPARYRAMALVAAYGGLRFGELTALRRSDVTLPDDTDPDALPTVRVTRTMHRLGGQWKVTTPKSAAGTRTVTLPSFLAPILDAHMGAYVKPGPDALLFGTASGLPLSSANFGKSWRRARVKAKLPDAHFHDLRHAAATLAVQHGATLKETMARLGHSSPRAALIYQHAASDRDAAIARALDSARDAAMSGNVIPLRRAE